MWHGWGSSLQKGQSLKGLTAEGGLLTAHLASRVTSPSLKEGLSGTAQCSPHTATTFFAIGLLPTSLVLFVIISPFTVDFPGALFFHSFSNSPWSFLSQDLCMWSLLCLEYSLCIPDLSSHSLFRCSSSFFLSLLKCCFLWGTFLTLHLVRMSGIYFRSLGTHQTQSQEVRDSFLPLSLEFHVEREGL